MALPRCLTCCDRGYLKTTRRLFQGGGTYEVLFRCGCDAMDRDKTIPRALRALPTLRTRQWPVIVQPVPLTGQSVSLDRRQSLQAPAGLPVYAERIRRHGAGRRTA